MSTFGTGLFGSGTFGDSSTADLGPIARLEGGQGIQFDDTSGTHTQDESGSGVQDSIE